MSRRFLLALVLAAALPSMAAARASYDARVTSVVDGDTLWVRRSATGAGTEIRLQGIDAPEICQRWGRESRDALRQLLLSRTVTVFEVGRDTYGRVLARLHGNGQDVGAWLVANGHAWSPGFHRRKGPYAQLEAAARAGHRGLWSQWQPMDPRTFRHQHGTCHH
jgi:endonuclease YncB( thermonuclease family)